MKKLILAVIAFLLACGAPIDEQDAQKEVFVTIAQPVSAKKFWGWQMNTGWEHQRCDMQSTSQDCAFPPRYSSGSNPFKRLLISPVESVALPSGFSWVDARTFGTSYFTNMSNQWEWVMTTQGTSAHLMITSNEGIYNGTPPNDTISLASIAHVYCSWNQGALSEGWNGRAYSCQQVTAELDVGSFTAWVNQWATSNSQRQVALDSVYRHFLGIGMGLGATNGTDTLMRRRLSRAQSPITITNYEKCLLDSVSYTDPNFPDGSLGVYTNNCN